MNVTEKELDQAVWRLKEHQPGLVAELFAAGLTEADLRQVVLCGVEWSVANLPRQVRRRLAAPQETRVIADV